MTGIRVTDLGLEQKVVSRLLKSGRIKTNEQGYVILDSFKKYKDFIKDKYYLNDRAAHLTKEAGISLSNFYAKVCKGNINSFLQNIGREGSGNSVFVYKKSDEQLIVEKLKRIRAKSEISIGKYKAGFTAEGINNYILERLVNGGTIKVNAEGNIDSGSLKEYKQFMKTHYILAERISVLMGEAGISRPLLYSKVYRRLLEEHLTNIGGNARGTALYAYRQEDEQKIIEILKKKPRGPKRQTNPNSQKAKKIARESTIDSSLIKISDASNDCSLEEKLFDEVLQRLSIEKIKIARQGVEIPTIHAEDYQKVRRYIWELKQL